MTEVLQQLGAEPAEFFAVVAGARWDLGSRRKEATAIAEDRPSAQLLRELEERAAASGDPLLADVSARSWSGNELAHAPHARHVNVSAPWSVHVSTQVVPVPAVEVVAAVVVVVVTLGDDDHPGADVGMRVLGVGVGGAGAGSEGSEDERDRGDSWQQRFQGCQRLPRRRRKWASGDSA